MKLSYYTHLLLISCSALLLSIIFVPSDKIKALMYFYDKQYLTAYPYYKKIYNKEGNQVSSAMPLVWLHLKAGQEEEAMRVLESFNKEHPQDLESLKFLAELYKQTSRHQSELNILEEINTLEPTERNIRRQMEIHRYYGNLNGTLLALQKIVANYEAHEQDFKSLSYLAAASEQFAIAEKALDQLFKKFPVQWLDKDTILFSINFFGKRKLGTKAREIAVNYISNKQSPKDFIELALALENVELYQEGLDILSLLPEKEQKNPEVITATVQILLSFEKPAMAYSLLLRHYLENSLPTSLYEQFFTLAVEEEEIETTKLFIRSGGLNFVSGIKTARLIEKEMRENRVEIIALMNQTFDELYLSKFPQVDLSLKLADSILEEDDHLLLLPYYNLHSFSDLERSLYASVAHSKGHLDLATLLLLGIESFDDFHPDDIIQLALLYNTTRLVEHGLKIAKKESSPDFAELLLLAAKGGDEDIEVWLYNHADVDEYYVYTASEMAMDRYPSVALTLAQFINSQNSNDKNLLLLSKALVLNKYYQEALYTLSFVKKQGMEATKGYVFALAFSAKEDPSHVDEKRLSNQVATALAYEGASNQYIRDIGYILANNGLMELAEPIFFKLAEGEPIGNEDVKTLLYIWGETLDEKKIQWIKEKVAKSNLSEKALWLSYLNTIAHHKLVISLINNTDLDEDSIADSYIEALIYVKEEDKLNDVISYLIPQESRLPRIKKFAHLARQEGLLKISRLLYSRAVVIDPTDTATIKNLGLINFSIGNLCLSRHFLGKYICCCSPDYQVYYTYAEILHFQENPKATDYFCLALQELERSPTDENSQSVKAQILHRLGKHKKAFNTYRSIIKENPGDPNMFADLANMLIDLDRNDLASYSLWCFQGKKELVLNLPQVRLFSENNQIKNAFILSNHLLAKYPTQAIVFASRADLEFKIGRSRLAERFISKAIKLENENDYFIKTLRIIRKDHLPWIDASWVYQKTGKEQLERFWRFTTQSNINSNQFLRLEVETDHIELENFQSAKDGLTTNVDTTKYRALLTLSYDFLNGKTCKGALFHSKDVYGVGAEIKTIDFYGSSGLIFEYHRPNWDFTQTTIENGSRDLIGIFSFYRIAPRLEGQGGYAFNIYNLNNFSGGATSHSLEFSLTYRIPRYLLSKNVFNENDSVTFNYYLDGEYKVYTRKKTAAVGKFAPIPLESRETHSWLFNLHKEWRSSWTFEGFAGYSFDRLAVVKKLSPIYGASVNIKRGQKLEGEINYSHTSSTQTSTADVDRFQVEGKYTF